MSNPTLHLPWPILGLILGLLVVCLWLAVVSVRKMADALERQPDGMLPLIGCDAPARSPLHSWDPRFKLVAILIFAFLVVSLKQPVMVVAALAVAIIILAFTRLPWSRSLRRIMAMNGFLAMFLIVMPLTSVVQPGDSLIVFGTFESWPLNLRGMKLALIIIGKAWTVALMMEPLLATAPLGATLEGLSRIGIPQRVSELLLIAHRYIHVFFGELQRMRSGMEARAFKSDHRLDTLKDYGNFVGMLLVRSFERTHRVYDAMQARGYAGRMPGHFQFRGQASDWLKALLLAAIGIGLLLADRLTGGGA